VLSDRRSAPAAALDPALVERRLQFARRLLQLKGERSVRQIANASDISRSTVSNLTNENLAKSGDVPGPDALMAFLLGCRLTDPADREPYLAEYDELYGSPPAVTTPAAAGGEAAGWEPSSAVASLREVHDEAVREIAYVLPQAPGRTAGVRLEDHLYVHRRIEEAVVRDVQAQFGAVIDGRGPRPRATAVLGEPGHGKSCLLWWLHRRFSTDAEVFLVPATAIDARAHSGFDPAWLLEALAEVAAHTSVVLLLDTADVLLHRRQDVAAFVALLERLAELGIPTVLASRVVEATLLEQQYRGNLSALLSKHVLGPYTEQEWPAAVDAYAAVFYRPPGAPPPRHGGVTPVEHLPADVERVRGEIAAAVARGLPMREVVVHPLSLRMLFEVSAPDSPATEVDVSDLHDRLWQVRVVEDRRAFADPVAEPATAVRDLSRVAGELGLAMISVGTFSIAYDRCVELIAARLHEPVEQVEEDLAELRRRDVIRIRVSSESTISFWHQTLAEHAAGRGMAAHGPAGLELLADRITAHPDDLLLAEVARHAFRARTDVAVLGLPDGTKHLAALLRHEDAFVRVTGLRLYAQQRGTGAVLAGDANFALERADTWEIIQFLDVLGSVRRSANDSWPADLAVVWKRARAAERLRLLTTLARLAYQQPGTVQEFLCRHRVLVDDDATPLDLSGVPSGRELSLMLRRFQYADPAAGQLRIEALWRAARAGRDGGYLRHLLAALDYLLAAGHNELDRFVAEVPDLIGALGQRNWSGGFEEIIEAASVAWSRSSAAALPAAFEDRARTWTGWFRVLDRGQLSPAERVRLRGQALWLRGCSHDDVDLALDTLLATRSATGWDRLARYVLVPLLGPGDEPGARAARSYCATHLTATTESLVQALTQRTRHRLPCTVIAACVPALEPAALLEKPWPVVITARAAAGGHREAQAALQRWLEDPDLRERAGPARAAQLRSELAKDVGNAPDLLDWLLRDARRSGDFSAITHLAQRGGSGIRRHADALGVLAAALVEEASIDGRATGYELLTRLVLDRHGPAFVTPSWLVDRIAAEENHRAFRKLAELSGARLLESRDPEAPDLLNRAAPALWSRVEAGDWFLEHQRWSETGDREHVLAGADAHRLLITLHAQFGPIGPVTWPRTRAEIERIAFEPIGAHLPPDDVAPSEWASRLAGLPHLTCRLTDAGRIGDALGLLDRAVTAIFESDPNPRAKWKNGHANRWRPFLRKVAIAERGNLHAHIHALAQRDEYLAQHLIEVSGQELVDIGGQLRELRLTELSASMSAYVRRTFVWAGRKSLGEAWPDLYAALHAKA